VNEKQIVGIIGPNGAGKSTLFNLLSGLATLTSGEILFNGCDMGKVPAHGRSAIGMTRTFQIVRLIDNLTVLDNVMLGGHSGTTQGFLASMLRLPGVLADDRKLRKTSAYWLDFVGLGDRAGEPAAHLPHGQQRLLELARAMIAEPKLLLLDEPAAGLNGSETAHLFDVLRAINSKGAAILIVEHDMKFIMRLCEHIVVLDHGSRIAEGTPEQVRSNPLVVDAYLGKKATNAPH
jgi:branched-chain amino acid transport system ATP-binding protein